MNHTYRLVWNDVGQCQVPAPENARSRGKRSGVKLLAAAMLAAFACNVHALPADGAISAGAGSIVQSGATMTVNQSTQNLAVNWQSFGIAANESVNFNQPNTSAIALNRVLGSDPSQILGQLNANGQVWVLNPNGVLFGRTAHVNVGGLVATTLNISDADFMAGKRTFRSPLPQAGEGLGVRVVNQGSVNATNGGYVALLGGQVSNEGVITARLGTVALAAGNQITLDFNGDKLLNVQVEQGALDALAQNNQLIRADGGMVLMTAQAADALSTAAVNNTGVIEARTLENHNGVIRLLGDMQVGTANVGGTLDASATLPPLQGEGWGGDGVNGGFIETSAHNVLLNNPTVTASAPNGQGGTWLIDPTDVLMDAGYIVPIVASLDAGTNVTVATVAAGAQPGNITVAADIAKTAGTDATLTLQAHNNIIVNSGVTLSSTVGALNVVLDADSDASGGGNIQMNSGSSITTNGGNITLGGGADPATTAAAGTGAGTNLYGVYLDNAVLNAGAGHIILTGTGFAGMTNAYGIYALGGTVLQTTSGNITLNGTGGAGTSSNYGVRLDGSGTNVTSVDGAISITGTGAGSGASNVGIVMSNSAAVTSTGSANITLDGRGAGTAQGIYTTGGSNTIGGASSTGNITLIADSATGADSIYLTGLAISGLGNLLLQPLNAATTLGLAGGAGTFNLGATELATISNGFANITLGRADGTGAITTGAWTVPAAANLTLQNPGAGSGGIAINGALTLGAGKNLTLNSSGAVTQTAAITAAGLELLGAGGAYTLTDAGNAITTLAGDTGSINLTDSNTLVVGAVNATSGNITLAATGDVILSDPITWTSGTLIIDAANDINIDAVLAVNDTAALTMTTGGTVNVGLTDAGFSGHVDFFQADGFTRRSGTGFLSINGNAYTVITDLGAAGSVTTTDLQGMSGNLAGYYALGANIDASATSGWNSGQGFLPVGSSVSKFTGDFDGLGHTVSGLTINPTSQYVGLFGNAGGTLRNVGIVGGSVTGSGFVGGLVGAIALSGTVSHSYASADVSATGNVVGGLVGWNNGGTVSDSHAAGNVSGTNYVGGLVGDNDSTIRDSHVSGGSVTASGGSLGGLVGTTGILDNSHYDIDSVTLNGATGEATPGGLYGGQYLVWLSNGKTLAVADYFSLDGDGYYLVGSVQALKDLLGFADQAAYKFRLTADLALPAGYMIPDFAAAEFDGGGHALSGLQLGLNNFYRGFIGRLSGGSVHDLGLTGVAVDGNAYTGALVGYNNGGTVGNSYATGTVSGSGNYVGGLVGYNFTGGSVSNSYATVAVSGNIYVGGLVGRNFATVSNSYASGAVSGSTNVGGLVGFNAGTVTASFWDTQTSGQATSSGGTGKTTAQMQSLATFAGWDIDDAGGTSAVWRIYDGYTNPLLRGFLTPLAVTPDYDGSGAALTNVGAVMPVGAYDASKVFTGSLYTDTLTLASTAADAYTATATANNLYSDQTGYDLVSVARSIATPGSASGDIALTAPIGWTSGTLAINTAGTVTDTAAINGTGTAIFDLQGGTWSQVNATLPGFGVYDFRISGGSFVRTLSGNGTVGTPYQFADIYGMQGMGSSGMLGLNYTLANNVDASGTANWNAGAGFAPVGSNPGLGGTAFSGSFDGLGHTITGLTINRAGTDFQGLFGWFTGTLRDVGLLNSSVRGGNAVDTLAGGGAAPSATVTPTAAA